MKIFLLAIGGRERASSRLRIWDHVDALRAMGHGVEVDSVVAQGGSAADLRFLLRAIGRYPAWLRRFFAADAIVLQQTMAMWPALLLKNVGKRRRVLFDFSDPVDRIGTRAWARWLRRMLWRLVTGRADAVMVENGAYCSALEKRGIEAHRFYGPVDVTRYDAARERMVRREDQRLRIGWTGSPGTYRFIAPLLPLIDALGQDTPIEVMLIGVEKVDHEFRHAKLTLVPWSEGREFDIVPSFDLGLFRIDDSEDARWRGAGKLWIYLAASVPFIATNRGLAADVMRESELGFPVDGDRAGWVDGLRGAVERTGTRDGFRARSLAFARSELSYERYRDVLLSILGRQHERDRR